MTLESKKRAIFELTIGSECFDFSSSFDAAIEQAKLEIQVFNETVESVKEIQPECDKLDYVLAASVGALCGIIDIFLVGKPGQSPLGTITDQWFANRTMDFAKMCGWKGEGEKSAIRFLEGRFKIPYDQKVIPGELNFLSPKNHHFKSLAHNPTLCGLFFSILDQFQSTSHFVTGSQIWIEMSDEGFELRGSTILSKLFCAFFNWLGHLISDVAGSSGRTMRGMGVPSPFWAWTNDVAAIRSSLNITASQFDETINNLAIRVFTEGFDARFQTTQAIPVFINSILVRTIYAVRRLFRYLSNVPLNERSLEKMWIQCEPFTNPTVNRMLTVAHGTFCLLDIGDATARGIITGGGTINLTEFFLRLNVIGIGQFDLKEKAIIENYLAELEQLAEKYNDRTLLNFVNDFQNSDCYIAAFHKSVKLAELRGVPQEKTLFAKTDIDEYFRKDGF